MNVQKVMWTLDELGLGHQREEAGMQYGVNTTPEYLAKNPNGKIPLLEDNGYAIWESHAICRYLCNRYQGHALYPEQAYDRGQVDQWLDWANSGINNHLSVVFWQTLRLPQEQRDPKKLQEETAKTIAALAVFNKVLLDRQFIATDTFTLADLAMAPVVYRITGLSLISISEPQWRPLADWYLRIKCKDGFKKWVEQPLS